MGSPSSLSRAASMATSRIMSSNNADFQISRLYNVHGKVALVTGGGSGIGLMATQALAVNGAKVYIVGRTEQKLKTVAKVHGENISGQIIPLVGDISKKDEIIRLVMEIESRESHLNILINNAGVYSASQAPKGASAEEIKHNLFDTDNATFEDWERVYRTNTASIYFTTTAFLPLLEKANQKSSHRAYTSTVINISSVSGMVATCEDHFAAAVCKAGTIHLTKLLATEIARLGLNIRINSIAPGIFPSEITARGSHEETMKSELPMNLGLTRDIAAGRPGSDEDMASAVLFLATNLYLHGQVIAIDGGYMLKHGKV